MSKINFQKCITQRQIQIREYPAIWNFKVILVSTE